MDDVFKWDHPRIRGEHRSRSDLHVYHLGSSPHTRGAPALLRASLPRPGIIPAYAGSTGASTGFSASSGDHPRIRGEHGLTVRLSTAGPGSSPHTRGALLSRQWGAVLPGIIPAYAGSTAAEIMEHLCTQDHPRIRGEHGLATLAHLRVLGSSPHTRGALHASQCIRSPSGIIPAYAGSTRAALCS